MGSDPVGGTQTGPYRSKRKTLLERGRSGFFQEPGSPADALGDDIPLPAPTRQTLGHPYRRMDPVDTLWLPCTICWCSPGCLYRGLQGIALYRLNLARPCTRTAACRICSRGPLCVFDRASTVKGGHGRGLLSRVLCEVGVADAAQHINLESVTAPHPGGPRHLNFARRESGDFDVCTCLFS